MTTIQSFPHSREWFRTWALAALLASVLLGTMPFWGRPLFDHYYNALYGAEYGARLQHLAR